MPKKIQEMSCLQELLQRDLVRSIL
jgi:hypothetical protein